jgi:hypothetical protein
VLGFLVKQLLGYFLQPGHRSRILTNGFGLANWAGLTALLITGRAHGHLQQRRPPQAQGQALEAASTLN